MDTKTRILDSAERLFANAGYAATSLRNIIGDAGVNLAAVHYHFHSKEELLHAVVMRRAELVNEKRLALLDGFEQAAAPAPPAVEKIVEAFLAPTFQVARDPALGGPVFVRLMGRMHAEGDLLPGILKHFRPVLERFSAAFHRALPKLPPQHLYWRMFFSVGAMAHALRGAGDLREMSGGRCNPEDAEAALKHLIAFLSAGLRAPAPLESHHETNRPHLSAGLRRPRRGARALALESRARGRAGSLARRQRPDSNRRGGG